MSKTVGWLLSKTGGVYRETPVLSKRRDMMPITEQEAAKRLLAQGVSSKLTEKHFPGEKPGSHWVLKFKAFWDGEVQAQTIDEEEIVREPAKPAKPRRASKKAVVSDTPPTVDDVLDGDEDEGDDTIAPGLFDNH